MINNSRKDEKVYIKAVIEPCQDMQLHGKNANVRLNSANVWTITENLKTEQKDRFVEDPWQSFAPAPTGFRMHWAHQGVSNSEAECHRISVWVEGGWCLFQVHN